MGSMVPYGSRKRLLSIEWTKRQGYLNQPLPQLHVIRYIDLLFSKGNKGIVLALFPFVNFFIIKQKNNLKIFYLNYFLLINLTSLLGNTLIISYFT